ncbi:MAG: isocitrate lyase/phosphoenolpyruvate mutase family protein [Pseudomonadota bacterium]
MTQIEKASSFRSLHQKGAPIVIYNIWDAGGAKALAEAGAAAVGTGSWSVAAAHGFADGEAIPLDFVLAIVERIALTVDVPVTVDVDGGYAGESVSLALNVARLIGAGVVGINFEDRIVQGAGLYSISQQAERIKAIKASAREAKVPLFLNARTDLFLNSDAASHKDHVDEALERAAAYAEAGADGFFVPGLTQGSLVERVTSAARLPVNVMMMGDLNSAAAATELGVSRISFGPGPYVSAIADLKSRFKVI